MFVRLWQGRKVVVRWCGCLARLCAESIEFTLRQKYEPLSSQLKALQFDHDLLVRLSAF